MINIHKYKYQNSNSIFNLILIIIAIHNKLHIRSLKQYRYLLHIDLIVGDIVS